MEHNKELRQAWDFVEHTGRSIFLTGKAGTGKTTFLKAVVERSSKRTVVVAPTGVAAINAGGATIHSFFQLPLSPYVPGARMEQRFNFGREKRKIIASMDLLIIDEISMVRSDLLDAIDHVLRRYRDRYQPFGGVQLLMIGDLQQLTPVTTPDEERMLADYYDTPYFFGSKALAQTDYVTIQLETVYRQEDTTFIGLLNHIRQGRATDADLRLLNSRYQPAFMPPPDEGYIRLTTHNATATYYNESELGKLPTRPVRYEARIEGTFPDYAYPTSQTLVLKCGAQVMFVKNDPGGRYYNGRIGRVTYADQWKVIVYCPGDADAITVEPLEWENTRYTLNPETRAIETEVQGTFRQYPLRLAWAITIHKSQGLTFGHAIIDAHQSFAPGQVYVALSRCKSLDGMVLASPIDRRAIIVDQRVDDYIGRQEAEARQSVSQLPALMEDYHRHLLTELFTFTDVLYKEEHLGRLLLEFFYGSHAAVADLHKRVLEELRRQVVDVAVRWTQLIGRMTTDALHGDDFVQRTQRSARYFSQTLAALMERPLQLARQVQSGNKQAMRRLTEALADTTQAYQARRLLLQRMADVPFAVATYLKQKQQALLDAMDEQDPQGNKSRKRERKSQSARADKGDTTPKERTYDTTFRLFSEGQTPEQIAAARSLSMGTIYSHLARFIATGQIELTDVLDPVKHQAILKVVSRVGADENLTAIKALCPPEVSFDEIRLVVASLRR